MNKYISLLIFIILLIYEKVWRELKYKRLIKLKYKNSQYTIVEIEKLSSRESIYAVTLLSEDHLITKTVKFSFLYNQTWY